MQPVKDTNIHRKGVRYSIRPYVPSPPGYADFILQKYIRKYSLHTYRNIYETDL